MTQLYKGHDERTQMNSEISTYVILLALKIATLSIYHQHKNKLIGRFIVWFGVVPVLWTANFTSVTHQSEFPTLCCLFRNPSPLLPGKNTEENSSLCPRAFQSQNIKVQSRFLSSSWCSFHVREKPQTRKQYCVNLAQHEKMVKAGSASAVRNAGK